MRMKEDDVVETSKWTSKSGIQTTDEVGELLSHSMSLVEEKMPTSFLAYVSFVICQSTKQSSESCRKCLEQDLLIIQIQVREDDLVGQQLSFHSRTRPRMKPRHPLVEHLQS